MVKSSIFILFEKVLRVIISFFVTAQVVRFLGPELYGIWAYAIAITAVLGFFPSLSLEGIVTRDLTQGANPPSKILGTILALKCAGGVFGFLLLLGYFFYLGDDYLAAYVLLITSLNFLIQPFDLVESILQVRGRVPVIVTGRTLALIVASGLKIYGLWYQKELLFFVIVSNIELAIALSVMGLVLLKSSRQFPKLNFDRSLAKAYLWESGPLILAGISVVLYMRLDQLMLSNMSGDAEVGIYSVSVRLTEIWYFVPVSLAGIIIQFFTAKAGEAKPDSNLNTALMSVYSAFWLLSLGLAFAVTVMSPFLIPLLFGEQFRSAILPAQIYSWTLPASFIGVASSQYLLYYKRSSDSLKRSLIGLVSNAILNFLLIPRLGALGAAAATLISYNAAAFSLFFAESELDHRRLLISSAHPKNLWQAFVTVTRRFVQVTKSKKY